MQLLIAALTAWTVAFTGLPEPERLPTVTFHEECELHAIVTGQGPEPCLEAGESPYRGAYLHGGRIILRDYWNPADVHHVGILVHELVHHLQWASGQDLGHDNPCYGRDVEGPAYAAQIAFVRSTGMSREEALAGFGINELALMFFTMCHHEDGSAGR